MADITTRETIGGGATVKGSPLTNEELDQNFINLNSGKADSGNNTDISQLSGVSNGIATPSHIDFDLASAVARASGRLKWNNTDGCLEVGVIGSNVTQQLGQEVLVRAYNADATDIANGDAVYFHSTAEAELVAVKKFIGDYTIDPHLCIGLATEDIVAGQYGYVCEFGLVRGLNTASLNPGDILYASPTVAGGYVNTVPTPPDVILHLGFCVESDSTNGIVLVNVHDVPRAQEIGYDNADSTLLATNVKSAIDELDLTKADLDLLTSNVTFYLTNANDPVIAGYKQSVTTTIDPSFDETAVNFALVGISNTATLQQSWITDPNVLTGTVSGIVIPFVGNFRKASGTGNARFYFEIYIRDDQDVETLLSTSNTSDYITSATYTQISLSSTITLQEFTSTDRVVLKLYGQTDSSTANYDMELGGSSPFRALFPVPVSVVPSVAQATNIVTDTTSFNGILSSSESSVQAALDVLDDHGHQLSDISGVTASNIGTTTTTFNGLLSATETDVQQALNVLDDTTLQDVVDNGSTVSGGITVGSIAVDNITVDGNTISSTDVDGDINLTPNGAGNVVMSAADINGGSIDGVNIGVTVQGTGDFTTLSADSASFTTVTDLGSVTTADINGGTIDGVTVSATILNVDNIQIDANAIISTNGNGNISLTPNGLGAVVISNVDVAAGEIDGTAIGANSASTGAFTNLTATGTVNLSGATVSNLGSVTTADLNGGTIDGMDITVGAGKTLNVTSGTLTLADDQISGNKINGGTISNFASTGINDDADALAVTITSAENVGINITDPDERLEVGGDIKSNTGADAGVLHLGNVSDQTKIVGRGSLHATLADTLDFYTAGVQAGRFDGTNFDVTGNITVGGTVDGRDLATDGTKLDGIDSGAQVNVGTNLGSTANGTSLTVTSSTGNNASLPAATTSAWGVMTDEDKTKLDGIAASATNTAAPAIEDVAGTPTLATGITAEEVRTAIGAGTSSTTGTVTQVDGGAGLTGSVTTSGSLAVGAGVGITVNANDVALATAGPGAATYGSTADTTKIDTITLDAYGRVTAIATGPVAGGTDTNTTYDYACVTTGGTNANPGLRLTGSDATTDEVVLTGGGATTITRTSDTGLTISSTNTTYSAGNLLDLTGTTFDVDLSELTDMTAAVVGSTDELVLLDNGLQRRKLINEIDLAQFNNSAGWTANVGDITGVTAGTGLSGGGTSGSVTLNLDFSELTDKTTDIAGTTEFIIQDGTVESRKAASEIKLSAFNNDAGWTASAGTVTSVSGSNGISGTVTTTGSLSLDSDLRGHAWQIGRDTNDYFIVNTTTHSWYLDGTEDMRLTNGGSLHVEGNITAYSTTVSDARLKDNVETIENGLEKVCALRGVSYDWNAGSRKGQRDIGVIAQEVQQVVPEVVREVKDSLINGGDYLSVGYDQLVPVLIEAIKELKAEIDALKGGQ